MADFSVPDIFSAIDSLAPSYGIDPGVAKSIILAENTKNGNLPTQPGRTFSGNATNSNSTMGVGQVIPSTARGLQQAGLLPATWKFDPNDLTSQLSASLAAMKDMKSRLRNPDDPFELGAYYNGGTNGLKNYQAGKPLAPETAQYLQKMRTGMTDLQMTPQQIERAASGQAVDGPGVTQAPGTMPPGSSSSSSTTLRSKNFDPAMLDSFNQALGMSNIANQNAQTVVGQNQQDLMTLGPAAVAAILQAGQSAGASAQATAAVQATGQATRAAILTRANLNPDQTQNRMDQALGALDSTSAQLDAMRPDIDARSSVGFFDNPLAWAVAQVTLPGMIGKYNNLVQVQQDALGKYSAAADITKSAIDMSTGIQADATLQAGNALAKAEADKAKAQAMQTQILLGSRAAADALQLGTLANQRSEMALRTMLATAATQTDKDTDTQKADNAKLMGDMNVMVKAAGGQGFDPGQAKLMTAADKDMMVKSLSTRKFGPDLLSAMQFVDRFGDLNNMAAGGQLGVRTWVQGTQQDAFNLTKTAQTAATAKNDKTFNAEKNLNEQIRTLGATYQMTADTDLRNTSEGGVTRSNPYQLAYSQFIKDPSLANNIWAQDIQKLGPGGTNQVYQNFDEQNFMNHAVQVVKNAPDPAAAIKRYANDISSFYKQGAAWQKQQTKYDLFGMATPSKTYAVQLPAISGGNKPTTIDMGDASQIENILTKKLASELYLNSHINFESRGGSGFGLIN